MSSRGRTACSLVVLTLLTLIFVLPSSSSCLTLLQRPSIRIRRLWWLVFSPTSHYSDCFFLPSSCFLEESHSKESRLKEMTTHISSRKETKGLLETCCVLFISWKWKRSRSTRKVHGEYTDQKERRWWWGWTRQKAKARIVNRDCSLSCETPDKIEVLFRSRCPVLLGLLFGDSFSAPSFFVLLSHRIRKEDDLLNKEVYERKVKRVTDSERCLSTYSHIGQEITLSSNGNFLSITSNIEAGSFSRKECKHMQIKGYSTRGTFQRIPWSRLHRNKKLDTLTGILVQVLLKASKYQREVETSTKTSDSNHSYRLSSDEAFNKLWVPRRCNKIYNGHFSLFYMQGSRFHSSNSSISDCYIFPLPPSKPFSRVFGTQASMKISFGSRKWNKILKSYATTKSRVDVIRMQRWSKDLCCLFPAMTSSPQKGSNHTKCCIFNVFQGDCHAVKSSFRTWTQTGFRRVSHATHHNKYNGVCNIK